MSTTHTPNDFEQMMLELINRARLDPQGEAVDAVGDAVPANVASAIRFFGVDTAAYLDQLAALDPVAPLAWNGLLADAATGHNDRLIAEETQTHRFPGGPSLGERVTAAGYNYSRVSENVFSWTEDPVQGHAGFFIDWGYDDVDRVNGQLRPDWKSLGDGIQDPPGHRNAIMSAERTEVGIAAGEAGPGSAVGPWVVTQNFGARWDYDPQLVGVVFDDGDGDAFYDMGEGLGGITITATGDAGTFTTTSWASGGYQMELPDGSYALTFSGAALNGEIQASATIAGANVKVDVQAADATDPPPSTPEPSDPLRVAQAALMEGTGQDELLEANSAFPLQLLIGGGGADILTDAAGRHALFGDDFAAGHLDEADAVFRMYRATLDRDPDAQGYGAWTQRMMLGQSEAELAAAFVGSPEFQATYGALDDRGFVTLLYQNVLDRAPDPQGLAAWVGRLAAGMDRADVVTGFANSPEFVAGTQVAAQGFATRSDPAAWTDDVFRLYQATLGRNPDQTGLVNWAERLADGTDYLDVAQGFIASPEFQQTYGALDNGAFVDQLYQNVLGRAADDAGRAAWIGRLDDGQARTEVVRGFAQSAEFSAATQDAVTAYLRGLGTDDTLTFQGGNDLLAGGMLSDTFAFATGATGQARILDLEAWDTLALSDPSLTSDQAARDAFEQRGADAVLTLGNLEITLVGVQAASLTDDQILLA